MKCYIPKKCVSNINKYLKDENTKCFPFAENGEIPIKESRAINIIACYNVILQLQENRQKRSLLRVGETLNECALVSVNFIA